MSGQSVYFIPAGLSGRDGIIKIRKEFKLSWSDLTRKMGYSSKGSVMRVWAHPETVNPEFDARLRSAWVSCASERGWVYEVPAGVVLPVRLRLSNVNTGDVICDVKRGRK